MARRWNNFPAPFGIVDVAAAAALPAGPLSALDAVHVVDNGGQVWRFHAGRFEPGVAGAVRIATSVEGSASWLVGSDGGLRWSRSLGSASPVATTGKLTDAVRDVAFDHGGGAWVTCVDGTAWTTQDGATFVERTALIPIATVAPGPDGAVWGVDASGNLWRRASPAAAWMGTAAKAVADVSVGKDGTVWLVGDNGGVWTTPDGRSFTHLGEGMMRVAAMADGSAWFCGRNGGLWVSTLYPDAGPAPKPTPQPPPPGRPERPTIPSITASIGGDSALSVNGSGFSPSTSPIVVRVSNGLGFDGRINHRSPGVPFRSDGAGGFSSGPIEVRGLLPSGTQLYVSCTDQRLNSADLTGFLWSNTVPLIAP